MHRGRKAASTMYTFLHIPRISSGSAHGHCTSHTCTRTRSTHSPRSNSGNAMQLKKKKKKRKEKAAYALLRTLMVALALHLPPIATARTSAHSNLNPSGRFQLRIYINHQTPAGWLSLSVYLNFSATPITLG